MENLTLRVGDGASAVELETADVKPIWESLRGEDGRRIGDRILWRCRAYLTAENSIDMRTERDSLLNALRKTPLSVYLLSDGVEVDSLKTAVLDEGPEFGRMEFAEDTASDWRSRALVSFSVYGCLFDKEEDVVSSNIKTEYIRDERGRLSKRVYGTIRVREGVNGYFSALRYQPQISPYTTLKRRSVAISEDGLTVEFDYLIEKVIEAIPPGVDFCCRMVEEKEEGGIKRVVYEATFAGEGAVEAAEEFIAGENVVSKEKSTEMEGGVIRVRYIKEEPVDDGDVVIMKSVRVSGGERKLKACHTKGNKVFFFWGEHQPVEVNYQEERLIYNASVRLPSVPMPETLILKEKEITVEPYLFRSDGEVLGWRMRCRLKYLSRSVRIDEITLMGVLKH